MGNKMNVQKVNFEDIQQICQHKTIQQNRVIMINTLSNNEQNCLINGTIEADKEEDIINSLVKNTSVKFIIYGKNANDMKKTIEQYQKLLNFGFSEKQLFIYPGGLFEWLLLQDIYGSELFPTTSIEIDHLKYKPSSSNLLIF